MKIIEKFSQSISGMAMEGALMALSPLPFLLLFVGLDGEKPHLWRLIFASVASTAAFSGGLILFRRPLTGKLFCGIGLTGSFAILFPWFTSNPFAALSGAVLFIGAFFALADLRIDIHNNEKNHNLVQSLDRARLAALVVPLIVILGMTIGISYTNYTIYCIVGSSIIAQVLFIRWAIEKKSMRYFLTPTFGFAALGCSVFLSITDGIPIIALLISLFSLVTMPDSTLLHDRKERWWEILLNHPARILLSTFSALCVFGTILLTFPIATRTGAIHLVDAAFTSVSAVCVTGLIVLDTPHDFTLFGQFFILLLIQLGGLGIMSITTVALHAMGRRLSLKQERLLTSITDTDHKDLLHSLATILKFTLIAEVTGAILLTILFYSTGETMSQAFWRGLFTSISAFCNAGFALQSDNLIPYQNNPAILHVVATLIIFGGMAPATSLIVPRWLQRKNIPIPAQIALITTTVLLFSGTVFILAFEWEGVLAGLSLGDKIQNAWFQAATLRTAGFNSVDIAKVTSPTFFIMLVFMFIGGSPGGTAGGVKTTTIGILAMTFWANVTNRNKIIIQNRRVRSRTIYQAVTIVLSGMIVWIVTVLMLETTQQISVRDIIFEATSAIGTVGLSTGATPLLDEIGKIIIMIAMFVGRIGPMTLFMLLSDDQAKSAQRYPNAKIPLT